MYLSMYVCLYPSSALSFDPIMMKHMDTPWDPGSACHGLDSEYEARGSEATAGVGKVAL